MENAASCTLYNGQEMGDRHSFSGHETVEASMLGDHQLVDASRERAMMSLSMIGRDRSIMDEAGIMRERVNKLAMIERSSLPERRHSVLLGESSDVCSATEQQQIHNQNSRLFTDRLQPTGRHNDHTNRRPSMLVGDRRSNVLVSSDETTMMNGDVSILSNSEFVATNPSVSSDRDVDVSDHLPPFAPQPPFSIPREDDEGDDDEGDDDEDDDDDDEDRQRVSSNDNDGNKMSQKYYHCRMCNKKFECKSEMQRHSKEIHRSEEKGHKCFKCLKTFPSSQQLAQHSLVHSNVRKYPCKYCDKSFKQLSHVQQHQRIHTGERPYRCSVEGCTKSFRQLSSLQQHLKGHTGPSNFKSYHVARSPTLAIQTNKNREKINTTLARPHDFTCQVCEKICEDEMHFYRHIHQHHPDYWRVFSGGQPLADFINDEVDLKQEPEESTFYCQRCRMDFPNEFGYWKHLSLFHPPGEAPQSFTPDKFSSFLPQVTDPANPGRDLPLFACPICKKLFTKQSYLVRHIELKTDPDHRAALENLIEKSNSMNSDQSPHRYDVDVARMMTSLSRNHGDRRIGYNFSAASMSSNEDQPIIVDDGEEKKDEKMRRRLSPLPPDFYETFSSPYAKFAPRSSLNFFSSSIDQTRP